MRKIRWEKKKEKKKKKDTKKKEPRYSTRGNATTYMGLLGLYCRRIHPRQGASPYPEIIPTFLLAMRLP